jgi:cytochrome c
MRRTRVVLALFAGVGLCLSMAATASAQVTNQPPTVSAARNPTGNVRVGVPIAFTATASDPDNDTLTYLWDFGDGTTSTEQNPTKTYLTSAVTARTVSVTVDDGKGGTASATLSVLVQANRNPSANGLTMSPQAGFAPLTVTWGGAATDQDGPSHTLTYSWDFDGDGTEDSTAQNPSHTFTTAANYSPRVTVRDPFGGSVTRTFPVVNVLSEARDPNARFRILVFSKTAAFRHSSIDEGITALKLLGSQNGIQVDAAEESTLFTDAVLAKYDVVVFLSTTGDVLNDEQQAAFERYIRSGHAYAGIHSATDTEYAWPWYGQLTGGYFRNHPNGLPGMQGGRPATVVAEDGAHHSTRHLPGRWDRVDEWYNYQTNVNPNPGGGGNDYSPRNSGIHVLLTLDESTYAEADGSDGVDDDHPISWCKRYDGGRMWYTGMGHTENSFLEPAFLQHILGGLEVASGVVTDAACGVTERHVPSTVTGTVPGTLSLTVGGPATFGAFAPGLPRDYATTLAATVVSTGGDATLAVSDPVTASAGKLVNGSHTMAQPLQLNATSAAGNGSPLAPLGADPLTLLSYGGPVSNDDVTVNLKQPVGRSDPLRTGTYSKTLVFTLSTTSP